MMKKYLPLLLLLFAGWLVACGEEAETPSLSTPTALPTVASSTPPPIPPLETAETGPVRPGCGDYRLLVTLKTDALGAGIRVAGPDGEVDVVWSLDGPGLALGSSPAAPRLFNDDNRDAFGIEGNETHTSVTARFVLLISGVQQGEVLQLEMGHEAPGPAGTQVTVANTRAGLNAPSPLLGRFEVTEEVRTIPLDLCAAEPMPLPEPPSPVTPPRLLAFFYPWWGTVAEAEPPLACSGDASGWVAEVDGQNRFITAHTPISHDGERTIYQQTACWMRWTDDNGRTGELYDVTEIHFLAEQMQRAQTSGIDAFIISVHGDNDFEMSFLQEKALPIAKEVGFQIAALYEAPETGWTYDDARDIALVGGHLRRLAEIAAGSTTFLTLSADDRRIVLFVDPAVSARLTSAEAWTAIRQQVDGAGVPYVLLGGPAAFAHIFSAGFDGVFNDLEVVETGEVAAGEPPYARRDERRLAYRATAWEAQERKMLYVFPVVPGWDPTIRRPQDGVVPRDYGFPGDDGAYYRTRWEDALENPPHWIVITSWNEWAEATEIEPSQEYPPSRFDFLQATKVYACLWRGGVDCP